MNLTPEQMNEAVEAAARDVAHSRGDRWPNDDADLHRYEIRTALTVALPILLPELHAAWQEQTAAKAGENPHASDTVCWCPDDWREPFDKTRCPQHGGAAYESVRAKAYREGAAAGVAASEKRVREALEDVREKASTLVASTLTTGLPAEEFIEDAYGVANALDALAALLSEEPGAG